MPKYPLKASYCSRCQKLLAQRSSASRAWSKRHPEYEHSKDRKAYKATWIKEYRKRLKLKIKSA